MNHILEFNPTVTMRLSITKKFYSSTPWTSVSEKAAWFTGEIRVVEPLGIKNPNNYFDDKFCKLKFFNFSVSVS